MINLISRYNIPVVEQHGSVVDPKAFMEYVHDLKNAEGFVIRWADGHRVKIKAHEYIQIHKAKEAILQDRNIVEIILDEHLDDVKPHLPAEDRDRLTQFESDFNVVATMRAHLIFDILKFIQSQNMSRKDFALGLGQTFDGYARPILFKNFEDRGVTEQKIITDVRNTIRNNLSKTSKYEAIREAWFPGVRFNA